MIFQLAWRNVWRHPKRTFLVASAIAFSVAVLEFFFSLQLKTYEAAINTSIGVLHGHLQVQVAGYNENPEIRSSIEDAQSLKAKISELPGVEGISVRAIGFGLISSGTRSYGAQIMGVEPQSEGGVSTIPGVVRKGEYLSNDDYLEAIVGSTLANNLRVDIGDELTIMSQGYDGSLVATSITVGGIFDSGSTDLDRATIQITLNDFQEQFAMGGRAHSIVIRANDLEAAEQLKKPIRELINEVYGGAAVEDLVVVDWEELVPGLKQMIELDLSAGWFFYASLVVIVSFSILNSFLMSVLERIYEFGVMLSLGAKSIYLVGVLITEAFLLLTIGILGGNILGFTVVQYFGHVGFSIPGSQELLSKWNLPATVYTEATLTSFFWPSFTVLVAGLIAILYPSFRVGRLTPLGALRGET